MAAMIRRHERDSHIFRWQVITFVTLWVGYAGYYVCRSNLSVAGPLIQAELAEQPTSAAEDWLREARAAVSGSIEAGLARLGSLVGWRSAAADETGAAPKKPSHEESTGKRRFGLIASVSILFYALGKFTSGMTCDFVGGRRMFLFGMFASVVCTVMFGLATGFAALLALWSINRLVQSMGWSALVKVASRWFPAGRHGTIFGMLTLSYLFGDATARLGLGALLHFGLGWRGLFFAAAGVLAAIAVAAHSLCERAPRTLAPPSPMQIPKMFTDRRERPAAGRSIRFVVAAVGQFLVLAGVHHQLRPDAGARNVQRLEPDLLEGSRRPVGRGRRDGQCAVPSRRRTVDAGRRLAYGSHRARPARAVMMPFLALLVAALYGLAKLEPDSGATVPLLLTSIVSFALLGPYSFLTGVLSLDFGGKRGSSTAAGLADTAGYLGAIISGYGVGAIAEEHGWDGAFHTLGTVAAVTFAAAVLYWYMHDVRRTRHPPPASV